MTNKKTDNDTLDKIYEWATLSRGEQNLLLDEYVWTENTLALANRLKRTHGNLIAVIAPQGAGKTALYNALPWKLSDDNTSMDEGTFQCKWAGTEEIVDILHIHKGIYYKKLLDSLQEQYSFNELRIDLKLSHEEEIHLTTILNLDEDECIQPKIFRELFTGNFIKRLERHAGKELIKQTKQFLFEEELEKYANLLIDTADFNKTKTHELDSHIKQIQDLWNTLCKIEYDNETKYDKRINIVIFFQKEIYDRYRHFFIGKFKPIYFIEPFKPITLVNYYNRIFDGIYPFTIEALTELAVLSRGIFRRFKTYIGLCLDNVTMTLNNQDISYSLTDNNLNNNIESNNIESNSRCKNNSCKNSSVIVTLQDVQSWIKDKTLVQDLELELHNIFPKQKGLRNITVQLLRELAHGSIKQSEIAEKYFDEYDKGASRFLSVLEENEYIKRSYEGKDKVVRLPYGEA